jgi:preprotein translocase subunit SecB
MQKAAFSLVKYYFDKINIDLKNHVTNDILLGFTTSGTYIKNDSTYELVFSVNGYNEGNEDNPYIQIQCVSLFKFENVNSIEEIPDYFYRNSIAILFPFVRAYVNIITTQASIPGVMLPLLNLTSLESILKESTVEK